MRLGGLSPVARTLAGLKAQQAAMRVLQVLDKGPAEGGVAVHVEALSDGLRRDGHDVQTLRLLPPAQVAPVLNGDRHRLASGDGLVDGLRQRAALAAILRDVQPQVIHVHGGFGRISPPLLAQLRASAPLVGTLHDIRPFCYAMTRRFGPTGQACTRRCGAGCYTSGCFRPTAPLALLAPLHFARRWGLDAEAHRQWRAFERVIVPSDYLAALAQQHGCAAGSLRVVPHGIVLSPLAASPQAEEPPRIVFLGALVDYKGPGLLVDALALLRDLPWQAVLAGEGELAAPLAASVAALGLVQRVELPGRLPSREAVQQLLLSARMLVLPSTVPESFGLAGVEALAAGTPVVSFGLGGVMQWLRPGHNGVVAATCSAEALADAMRPLLLDAALAARLGAAGRADVTLHFDPAQALERTWRVYAEATATRGAACTSP